jgi:DEAD/DEAH box helicase domain-containing protein
VDIRGSGGHQVAVVEAGTGRLLGTVDPGSACAAVHQGAVYLHRGDSFVVDELDLDTGVALVHPEEPDWHTSAWCRCCNSAGQEECRWHWARWR